VPSTSTPPAVLLRSARLLQHFRPGERTPLVDVLVADGQVRALGPDLVADGADVVDLQGRNVLPGLRDAHTHVASAALARGALLLHSARSAREVADRVATWTGTPEPLLYGRGFHDALFDDEPHKALLDNAAPGVAVVLRSNDGHSAWFSSAALDRAGVDHPTGLLRETQMLAAVAEVVKPRPEDLDVEVAHVLRAAAARGVTEIYDIEGAAGWVNWQRRARAAAGGLGMRVWVATSPDGLDEALRAGRRTGQEHGLLRGGYLKLFADGALGSRTALCDHAYEGSTGNHGMALSSTEQMTDLVTRAASGGIRTAIHAIGDAANRNALDAFAAAGAGGRIEHAQQLAPDDVARFARLGVVASVQPSHLLDDRDVADEHLGAGAARMHVLQDLHRAGARLEFGSDAPVAPLDPWLSISAAVHRTGDDRPAWYPDQRLPLDLALGASTARPALVESETADLVVLDADPVGLSASDLAQLPVWATMVDGRWTHRADGAC
jgi:predicted amidohydrolase YtcJ